MLVDFYHLASTPLEQVLPGICENVIQEGRKLLVVADPEQVDSVDRQLWSFARDSFLPHGRTDGPAPERQPILVSTATEPLNGAAAIAIADGVWREEALAFEHAFYLFGEAQLDEARAAWRSLKDRPGVERRYWKRDESGQWAQGL